MSQKDIESEIQQREKANKPWKMIGLILTLVTVVVAVIVTAFI